MNGFVVALLAGVIAAATQADVVTTEVSNAYDTTYKKSTIEQKFRFGKVVTTSLIDTTSIKWKLIT